MQILDNLADLLGLNVALHLAFLAIDSGIFVVAVMKEINGMDDANISSRCGDKKKLNNKKQNPTTCSVRIPQNPH